MLETAYKLGNIILPAEGAERTKKFLETQTIVPNTNTESNGGNLYEIIINLNTQEDQIEVKLGKELGKDLRSDLMGFKLMGKAGRKIYFTTNNLNYHLKTIGDAFAYLNDKKSQMKGDLDDFLSYLEKLRDQFCQKSSKKNEVILNLEKLVPSLYQAFKTSVKDKEKINPEKELEILVVNEVLRGTRNDLNRINIFSLTIDGHRPHDPSFDFQEEYLQMLEYERVERFFHPKEKLTKSDGICSYCKEKKMITGKIDFPTKFFITDKPTYFENLNYKNAYRSFAICKNCYQNLMAGIDKIQQDFSDNLFNVNYFLIPKSHYDLNGDGHSLEEKVILINDILKEKNTSFDQNVQKHKKLLEELKSENLSFDFFFYWKDQAAFNVAEVIPDVEFHHIEQLRETLDKINNASIYTSRKHSVNLNSIKLLLFPNEHSHSRPDPALFRKELLQILRALLKGGNVSYRSLIHKNLFITKKSWFKGNKDYRSIDKPLQLHVLFSLFNRYTHFHGLNKNHNYMAYTEIPDENLQAFFNTHPEVYAKHPQRQGLVLLGALMNQILQKQRKQNKSSTILDKLNFDGIPPKRVLPFANEIGEYLKVYQVFYPNTLKHAAMQDRIQDIENSGLSKDEVVFYILTGVSLSSYFGNAYKQSQQTKNQDHE